MELRLHTREVWRSWRRRAVGPAVSAAILALGVASTASFFGVFSRVFIQPLPWPAADRLVAIHGVLDPARQSPGFGGDTERAALSWPMWDELRAQPHFELVGGWIKPRQLDWTFDRQRTVVSVWFASADFLRLLGARTRRGNLFVEDDDLRHSRSLLLTSAAWVRHFGGDSNVLGRTVSLGQLGQAPFEATVSGVLEPGFEFRGEEPDFILPIGLRAALRTHEEPAHFVVARLKPGVSIQSVGALVEQLAAARKGVGGFVGARAVPLRTDLARDSGPTVGILFAGALLLMVTAAMNAVTIMTGEVTALVRDLRIRLALGGSLGQVLRRYVVEYALLGSVALAGGFLLTWWALPLLSGLVPVELQGVDRTTVDFNVLAFSACVAFSAALAPLAVVCGFAVTARRSGVFSQMDKHSGPARRVSFVALTLQLSLAMLLIVSAIAFGTEVLRAQGSSLGFEPRGLTVVSTASRDPRAARQSGAAFVDIRQVVDRLRAVQGVDAVSSMSRAGLFSDVDESANVVVPGDERPVTVSRRLVGRSFFETMAIPIVAGRGFADGDELRVSAVVSESFSRKLLGGGGAGVRIRNFNPDGSPGGELVIVGVAGDTRLRDLARGPEPMLYLLDTRGLSNHFLVRSDLPSDQIGQLIRETLAQVAPSLIVTSVSGLEDSMRRSIDDERTRALTAVLYASLALFLALVGIAAESVQQVKRRAKEIAILRAIGARPSDVVRACASRAAAPVVSGLLLGVLVTSWWVGVLRTQTSREWALSAGTIAAAIVFFGAVCFIALLLPMAKAGRGDSFGVLRE